MGFRTCMVTLARCKYKKTSRLESKYQGLANVDLFWAAQCPSGQHFSLVALGSSVQILSCSSCVCVDFLQCSKGILGG